MSKIKPTVLTNEELVAVHKQNIRQYELEAVQQEAQIAALSTLDASADAGSELEQREAEYKRVVARLNAFRDALRDVDNIE